MSLTWARKVRGLSQRALARALKIHPAHVSEMESGIRNCPMSLQEAIADELDCPPEILAARRNPDDDPGSAPPLRIA
jgi:transcriptional regulator with XRE-family HTH domain